MFNVVVQSIFSILPLTFMYKIDKTKSKLSITSNGVLKSPDIYTEDGQLFLDGFTWERSIEWQREYIELHLKKSRSSLKKKPYRMVPFAKDTMLKVFSILSGFGLMLLTVCLMALLIYLSPI